MKASQSIAVAVVYDGENVLIGQRPEQVPLAGYWEFPGGKVEPNETPEAAAVRECREESGLLVRVLERLPQVVHDYEHARVELHFFLCVLTEPGEPSPPFCWAPRRRLPSYTFPPANQSLIAWLKDADLPN